ncbi:hypothetical protein [Cohaesibacter haloalkalitolerans]|uniref:hypothetical protein n=1 Tax=Cohaesibacter haloalkalitolerans TaxID=1162980 RepID=UPI000E6476C2|nr:hypothetical protein [Cohaesibacter haloalkalitolerans]
MADYYAILKRAVEAVPSQSREQRQTIYDKARKALLTKLQNMDPPLAPADISKQRMALEEAIRAVERDLSESSEKAAEPAQVSAGSEETHAGRGPVQDAAPAARAEAVVPAVATQVAPVAPSAPKERPKSEPPEPRSSSDKVVRRAGQDVLKNAVRDANALGEASKKAVNKARDAADAVGDERDSGEAARIEPTLGDAVVSQSKTYKRPSIEEGVSERPGYASDDDGEGVTKPKFGMIAIVLIVIGVLAGSGYLLYANRDAFLSSGSETVTTRIETQAGADQAIGKTEPGQNGTASDMEAKSVRTITVAPPATGDSAAADDGAAADAATAPAAPADTAANATAADDTGANNASVPVAQRSILYEEPGSDGEPGSASGGEVVWKLEGSGDDAVVRIDATIPDRSMSFDITIKKNLDAELPASHLIEISASRSDGDPTRAIVKIPGLILKPTEQSRGEGLVGAAIRIADDLHWVALTSGEREERYNLELLHLRGWIDIPIQYQSGRRAILTLEKGDAGDKVISDAIAAWTGQ